MPCLMLSMRVKHLPVPLLSLEATWGRSFIGALGWILRVLMCGTEFVRNQVGRLGIKMRTLCREDPPSTSRSLRNASWIKSTVLL
jgi:hypothetical protein